MLKNAIQTSKTAFGREKGKRALKSCMIELGRKWAKEGMLMAFDIKVKQAKSTVGEMDELIKKMNSCQVELSGICFRLRILYDYTLHTYIKSIEDEITHTNECQCEMKNLQNALGNVIYQYVKTENSIKAESEQALIKLLDERGENPLSKVTEKDMNQAIADFEKDHEDEVKDLNKFLKSGESNDLTDEDIRHIKYLLYTAPEPYRSIYLDNISKFKIKVTDNTDKSAFYQPWRHRVTYAYPESFYKDPRGPYTVFFHECGHAIDDLGEESKWLGSDTENYEFKSDALEKDVTLREAIEYDVYYNKDNRHSVAYIANMIKDSGCDGKKGNVNRVINALKKGDVNCLKTEDDYVLYDMVIDEVTEGINDVTYEAVSDVYGGVSNNALRGGGYGHENDYWQDEKKAAKELWAEYFSYHIAGDAESLAAVYEYFPEASKGLDAYTQALGEKK